jgi:uncharacterized protein YoxC
MWKQFLELFHQVLTLTEDARQNRAEIKELRKQVDELTATVQRLVYEIHRIGERETHEREKFVLRVENYLLKANRQLPPDHENEK